MTDKPAATASPLAAPEVWNAVAEGYSVDIIPLFELFADDAIALADLRAGDHALDVACGPGTLSLRAARIAERVVAVDFASEMVAVLRRTIAARGIDNVEAHEGDGQSLPFADGTFDAAFSMFGLIFFPDRAAGFSELHRVLRPGSRAVVGSWPPSGRAPLRTALFEGFAAAIPDFPTAGDLPLSDVDTFRAEMTAAGFTGVEIHTRTHPQTIPSVDDFWEMNIRSNAPIVMMRERMGEVEMERIGAVVRKHLTDRFGAGPIDTEWTAYLGVGVKA